MKKVLYILLLVVSSQWSVVSGQARITINSGYIVLGNGNGYGAGYGPGWSSGGTTRTLLVVHNPATNAITRVAGGILSEREYNMVQWDIGTAAAGNSYVVPFYYLPLTSYIPVTLLINTAGAGSGTIRFSTWHTINDNWVGHMTSTINEGPPHDVENMNDFLPSDIGSPSATDNSYNVVDRFWIVDAHGDYYVNANNSYTGAWTQEKYTTVPDPKITFSYLNNTNASASSEVLGLNNSIDGTLLAQRFDTVGNTWGKYLGPTGTTSAAGTVSTVTTTGVDVTAAGFFRSWTLSSSLSPLPIQLTSFTANCDSNNVLVKWSSATEINNHNYTLERSADGVNFQVIAIVNGAGTSSTPDYYSYIDYSPLPGTSYYRLSQTDFDGHTTVLNVIPFTQCENSVNTIGAYNSYGIINISINSTVNDNYTFTLQTVIGQPVLSEEHPVSTGSNTIKLYPNVSDGIYLLNVKSNTVNYTKKLYIGR
ncbi:MAG: hypothetical protein ACLQQ4_13120 [Bacteroidia bacterium]